MRSSRVQASVPHHGWKGGPHASQYEVKHAPVGSRCLCSKGEAQLRLSNACVREVCVKHTPGNVVTASPGADRTLAYITQRADGIGGVPQLDMCWPRCRESKRTGRANELCDGSIQQAALQRVVNRGDAERKLLASALLLQQRIEGDQGRRNGCGGGISGEQGLVVREVAQLHQVDYGALEHVRALVDAVRL